MDRSLAPFIAVVTVHALAAVRGDPVSIITLAALVGLPLGYGICWCWDCFDKMADACIEGQDLFSYSYAPEVWR
jgi:hypothetical protein